MCWIDAQRLREGRGPPRPAVRALCLGIGLQNLSPDAHDESMKVDCAILQDHVKDEEEELHRSTGALLDPSMTSLRVSPSQQAWSRVQERRSAHPRRSVGRGSSVGVLEADGAEDPLGPGALTCGDRDRRP